MLTINHSRINKKNAFKDEKGDWRDVTTYVNLSELLRRFKYARTMNKADARYGGEFSEDIANVLYKNHRDLFDRSHHTFDDKKGDDVEDLKCAYNIYIKSKVAGAVENLPRFLVSKCRGFSQETITRRLDKYIPEWRDQNNSAEVAAYCEDLLRDNNIRWELVENYSVMGTNLSIALTTTYKNLRTVIGIPNQGWVLDDLGNPLGNAEIEPDLAFDRLKCVYKQMNGGNYV